MPTHCSREERFRQEADSGLKHEPGQDLQETEKALQEGRSRGGRAEVRPSMGAPGEARTPPEGHYRSDGCRECKRARPCPE